MRNPHNSNPSRLALTTLALVASALFAGCERRDTAGAEATGAGTTAATVEPAASAPAGSTTAAVRDVLADPAITARVKTALLADDEVKGLQIDVDTADAVVTLNGSVESQAQIDRAASVAEKVEGVKSVQNRLNVSTEARGADTVGTTSGTAGAAAGATAGAVTGAASAAADSAGRAMSQAGDAASRAASTAGDVISDSTITAKVKAALLADKDIQGLQINVDTRDGVVTLAGNPDNKTNLDRAVSVARKIDGVKSVENKMTVKSPS